MTTELRFGKLRIKEPQDIFPSSHKKILCVCDCGKEALITICSLYSGNTKSCGKCNLITAAQMKVLIFSKLRMKYPKDILPGSGKKETWLCDCGNEKDISINNVTSGRTKSCGRCNLIKVK